MSNNTQLTRENLDDILKQLGKEFRKRNGKTTPAEIIISGGAAIVAHYGFRQSTQDVDAIIRTSSAMKDAISVVAENNKLPSDWLNSDFLKTASYSPKLIQYSVFYRKYANVLEVRIISAEYLIATKLMAGRMYKNDLSDVIGILAEESQRGNVISREKVQDAVQKLYGQWERLPVTSRRFYDSICDKADDYNYLYQMYAQIEKRNREHLIEFESKYPNVLSDDNINGILENFDDEEDMEI